MAENKHPQPKTKEPTPPAAKTDQSIHSSTGYWVTLLFRAIESEIESRLKIHDVTRAGYAVLNAIRNDHKSTPASLASFIGIDRAAITRHLDRLEKQELIVREPSKTDRRSVDVKLTRKGFQLVPKLVAHSKATNAKFLTGLTASEKQTLHELIQKMLSNSDRVLPDF